MNDSEKQRVLSIIEYINEIDDIEEIRQEFRDLYLDYHELNVKFTRLAIEHYNE